MEPAATMSASPVSALGHESVEVRARRLAAARRRATALLAGVTVVFVAVTAVGVHGTLLGYVQAGAEAAMIGGIAALWNARQAEAAKVETVGFPV